MKRTWSEDWEDRLAGKDCPMCDEGRPDSNDFGVRFFEGTYVDGYLLKVDHQDGFSVAVWRGRHIAEPTELSAEESAGYWQEVLAMARALESHFKPTKINYLTMGNSLPHMHTHIIPRYVTDSSPGAPLPFPQPGQPVRSEQEIEKAVDALKGLV